MMFDPTPADLPAALHARMENYRLRFNEALAAAGLNLRLADAQAKALGKVWATSDFVAEFCLRHPLEFSELLRSGDLENAYPQEEWQRKLNHALADVSTDQTLSAALRQFRLREMVRIAWRDLAGWATLAETLLDLSMLAEVLIDGTLDKLHAWQSAQWGMPCNAQGRAQSLVVIGMGKLGAAELNFSSDVDLIFAYPEDGETLGAVRVVSNAEYFTKLAQTLVHALAARTVDGFVFRVDLRLRPFGDSGPLVLSFSAMEDYYQTHGREWERYAMVKARVVAGDREQGQRLMTGLLPFVYRRYPDFGAFSALRAMKELIVQEMQRKGLTGNIKLGFGGIREIEFIGQVFQLAHGGRDIALQERGILPVLQHLGSADYLPVQVTRQLAAAYEFLRRVENRLQEFADRQTHVLPTDDNDKARLAWSMNYANWESFRQVLNEHMQHVHGHFEQVFALPQGERRGPDRVAADAELEGLWQGVVEETSAAAILAARGYAEPSEALRWLNELRAGSRYRALSPRGRKRMDCLMPTLIAAVGLTDRADAVLPRLIHLIEAIARRTAYLALLIENPLALAQLVTLCAASPWIATMLARHPLLLDELLDPRALYRPLDKHSLQEELKHALRGIAAEDLERQMEALRHFKQVNVLRVAAADSLGMMPLMIVSDHLTAIAEVVLQAVLELAWEQLLERHGAPRYISDGQSHAASFAIVAYGKLGGIELGYGSDLDLVFLHDSVGAEQQTTGAKPLDNAVFFARLGQRIIHMLGAHTPAGVLYEVDLRLRPSGASGLLVSSLTSFADYQQTQAWTWEHQALVRARVVAEILQDKPIIAPDFAAMRSDVLSRPRDPAGLRSEVHSMRERMRAARNKAEPDGFDLKQDAGGIADIEFVVQYAALLWAPEHPGLLRWTDNIRLLESFAAIGRMSAPDVQCLCNAYRAYRAAVHRLALQDSPARVGADEFNNERACVSHIWQKLLET